MSAHKESPTPTATATDLLESAAVHKHLDILQEIINRLAGNASACKNWCITLVAGVVVLSFTAELKVERSVVFSLSYLIIGIFLFLDSYYHGLERAFRKQSNELMQSIHDGKFDKKGLLIIGNKQSRCRMAGMTLRTLISPATGLFYVILAAAVFLSTKLCTP